MIDVEDALRLELERFAPVVAAPDWSAVLQTAGVVGASRRRQVVVVGVCAACAAALAAIVVATPLGATIARGLGGFSAWITGDPGSPAPRSEQDAFARANARSWLGFPAGTRLRVLTTVRQVSTGRAVRLLGFRSDSTLCIRVLVLGKTRASRQSCAPLSELRQTGAPVRAVMVDQGFGRGTKRAWYGIERVGSPAIQLTTGIVADGVKSVTLHDNAGVHTVPTVSNAFLYVAWSPGVGQRVDSISATTETGRVVVPFAEAPFGFGVGGKQKAVRGPTHVQRVVKSGKIGWLERREPVGQPLSVLPPRVRHGLLRRQPVFGRVINADPGAADRIAVTVSNGRNGGKATEVCVSTVTNAGAGGGCDPLTAIFAKGPIGAAGTFTANGSDEFTLVSGVVSDDVKTLVAYLSNGQTQDIRVVDNVYLVPIARSKFPLRIVAYDGSARIIGITSPLGDFGGGPSPARGRTQPLLHVTSPSGATATLYAGKSTTGGKCMSVRWYQSKLAQGVMGGCSDRVWHGSAIKLSGGGPSGIWQGQTRPDVFAVELTFSDGVHTTIEPTDGFVLYAVPASELTQGHYLSQAIAHDAAGKTIGRQTFRRPPPK